jgi:hypothetical protein
MARQASWAAISSVQFLPVRWVDGGVVAVDGEFAALQRGNGADGIGADVGQAVAERYLCAVFDFNGLIAGAGSVPPQPARTARAIAASASLV